MDIGKAVKEQRIYRKLSVRDLAAITGLSPGAISKIENGKTIPNVITMKNIASAMGIAVSHFFIDEEEKLVQVVRKNERSTLVRNKSSQGEVREEILFKGKDIHMQPGVLVFTGGSDSGNMVSHKGEEFIYLLEGSIECILEGIGSYKLEMGDSMYYPSSIPHKWRNLSNDSEAKLIVVASPATF